MRRVSTDRCGTRELAVFAPLGPAGMGPEHVWSSVRIKVGILRHHGPGLKSPTTVLTHVCLRVPPAQIGAGALRPSGTRASGQFQDRAVALLIGSLRRREAMPFLTSPRLEACFGACRVAECYARRCPDWRDERSQPSIFEGICQRRLSPKDGASKAAAWMVRRACCCGNRSALGDSPRTPPFLGRDIHPNPLCPLAPFRGARAVIPAARSSGAGLKRLSLGTGKGARIPKGRGGPWLADIDLKGPRCKWLLMRTAHESNRPRLVVAISRCG
jgi:hypothetical protein